MRKVMAEEVAKRYEPTAEERAALDAYIDRKKDAVACPRLKFTHNEAGLGEIAVDHVEPRLAWTVLTQALGSTDTNFASVVASQLASAVGRDLPLTEGLNFMLAVVKAIEPKNELESLLATQMAAVHVATMAMACRLASSTNIKQQDSAERALNKLARTLAMQLETLKRYRTRRE